MRYLAYNLEVNRKLTEKEKAVGSATVGAVTGAGVSTAVGGVGLAAGGTAVALGLGAFMAAFAVVGLAGYGVYKAFAKSSDSEAESEPS